MTASEESFINFPLLGPFPRTILKFQCIQTSECFYVLPFRYCPIPFLSFRSTQVLPGAGLLVTPAWKWNRLLWRNFVLDITKINTNSSVKSYIHVYIYSYIQYIYIQYIVCFSNWSLTITVLHFKALKLSRLLVCWGACVLLVTSLNFVH